MENNELIKRFLEETNYLDDNDILAIIVYGSRIVNNRINSDLDVMIISSKNKNNYLMGRIIDGVKIDCHIYSSDAIYNCMYEKCSSGNRFFDSVLHNGIVVKNKDGIVEQLECFLNNLEVKRKKKEGLSLRNSKMLVETYHNFKAVCQNENLSYQSDYWYFNLLELIRRTYHYMRNCCYLNVMKVYDVYLNKDYYENLYQGKLPNDEFIELYLEAIKEFDNLKREKILINCFKLLNIDFYNVDFLVNGDRRKYLYNKHEVKEKLLELNNKICKVIDMLLSNCVYVDCCYNILLYQISDVYSKLPYDNDVNFDVAFGNALIAKDVNERIDYLEKLFAFLDSNYRFDYDDYYLLKMN